MDPDSDNNGIGENYSLPQHLQQQIPVGGDPAVVVAASPASSSGAAAAAHSTSLGADLGVLPSGVPETKQDPSSTSSNTKIIHDPPGWAIPIPHMRELEWWAHQKDLRDQAKRAQAQARKHKPFKAEMKPPKKEITQHKYDEYLNASGGKSKKKSEDDEFAWMPPPEFAGSLLQRSPDGKLAPFRTREAQDVFESTLPKRSWSVEDDDEDAAAREESSVVTDWSQNSWIIPMMNKPIPKNDDDSSSIIEEEVMMDENGDEIIIEEEDEEEILEEEILEEEVIEDEDESTIEEEIVSKSTTSNKKKKKKDDKSSSSGTSSSSSSTPWRGPKVTKETSKRAPVSLASSSSSSSSTSIIFPAPSKRAAPPPTKRRSRANNNTSSTTGSSSSASKSSSSSATTSAATPAAASASSATSVSTQIIYIQDDRDLEKVVNKVFDGDVLIEDDFQVMDQQGYFVPSVGVLVILSLLIGVVLLAICLGLYFYFDGKNSNRRIL